MGIGSTGLSRLAQHRRGLCPAVCIVGLMMMIMHFSKYGRPTAAALATLEVVTAQLTSVN